MALSSKERFVSENEKVTTPIVEVGFSPEIEQSEYIKETNEEVSLKEPILDDAGRTIVENANSKEIEKIVLPLTEQEMDKALHKKVAYSVRWLAEWVKRLLKITSGKINRYHYEIEPQEQGA